MSLLLKIKSEITGNRYDNARRVDDDTSYRSTAIEQAMPLWMKIKGEGERWLLPWEPMISVRGSNSIAKRKVAKAKDSGGSIKEYWSQDDYEITIEGLFTYVDSNVYPRADLEKLKTFCEAKKPIEVEANILEGLGITSMIIEEFDIPFTVGPANPIWTIKAVSDKDWELLVKE